MTDDGHALQYRHAGQFATAGEGSVANIGYASRNRRSGQGAAAEKGMFTNASHAGFQDYRSHLLPIFTPRSSRVGVPISICPVIIFYISIAGNGQRAILRKYPNQVITLVAAGAISNAGQHSQGFIFNGRLSLSVGVLEDLAAAGTGIVGVIANTPVGWLHRLGFDHIVDMGAIVNGCIY